MIIFIRHGQDMKKDHSHDEVLIDSAKTHIETFTESLVEENGLPDIIYCSPFYRTRQTAKYMKRKIRELYGVEVRIKIERSLGRFFSETEQESPDIHDSTHRQNPIIHETRKDFKKRVYKFHKYLSERKSDKNVWNITHSLVLIRIIKHYNLDRSKYIQYLDKIII